MRRTRTFKIVTGLLVLGLVLAGGVACQTTGGTGGGSGQPGSKQIDWFKFTNLSETTVDDVRMVLLRDDGSPWDQTWAGQVGADPHPPLWTQVADGKTVGVCLRPPEGEVPGPSGVRFAKCICVIPGLPGPLEARVDAGAGKNLNAVTFWLLKDPSGQIRLVGEGSTDFENVVLSELD
jgi:hypothetical protein